MQILYIELHPRNEASVELRYQKLNGQGYEKQILQISEIADLIALAERDIYVSMSDPVAMGKQLFGWLDGEGRWLSRALADCQGELLVLAIANLAKLPHLPWEVLHDREGFLIDRTYPKVVPVRWTKGEVVASEPADRPLRVMFMATDPEGVEPRLNFEGEEGRILDATRGAALTLRVEESGCVSELKKTWRRYGDNHFDVFHLTGHASIADDGQPFFITETETGDRYDAKAGEIVDALRFRLPRLVFLSGCRTGQAGEQGATPSMAEALLNLGLTAVLGWGRPIGDDVATLAAACLYESLASANSLVEAIAATYQKLREENIPNWYLLRLYGRGKLDVSLAALVLPLGDRLLPLSSEIEQLFLDPDDATTPRVVRREDFVGRRRILQSSLRRLQGSDLGVLLHGMGGLGKTTVAKRLLERIADPQNSNYDTIFNFKQFDEGKLLQDLARNCTSEAGHEILNGRLPLMQKLTKFLKEGMNDKDRCLMFVLDDFEENLEENVNGVWVLKFEVVEPLMALVSAIARSGLRHRLIVTCRYDFNLPDVALNARLFRVPLFSLRGVDLKKKCDRLAGFQLPMLSREEAEPLVALQKQAIAVADGNPRLLEWLAAILPNDLLTEAQKQEVLDRMMAKQIEFRENILAETLMAQQSPDLREMLKLGLVFDLPVPELVFAKVCEGVENLKSHQVRAKAISLLEVNGDLYRVPKILVELLSPEFTQEIYATASRELYRVWFQESESSTEEQKLEIHRLALLGDEKEIAVKIGVILTSQWKNKSRFREAIHLCESTLKITDDYRILHQLARSQKVLGEVELAKNNYQKALDASPSETTDEQSEKAAIIHNLAVIYAQQGQVDQAIDLYQQSLEIKERIGDVQGRAATLSQMGILLQNQGKVEEALALHQQSLELKESIGNLQGKATSLSQIAMIYNQQGQVEQAIALYQQSLEIWDRIGDVQGKAATLHQMAGIYNRQGQVDQAIALYQQSIDIEERIGNVQGKAATLHQMAGIYADQGQVDQAIALYQQSVDIEESIGDVQGKAATLHQMAMIYAQQGQVEQAIDLYQQSLEITDRIGDVQGKAATLAQMANIYQSQGLVDKAFEQYHQVLEIARQIGAVELEATMSHQIALIYANQGQVDEALKRYQKATEIYESIGNIGYKAATLHQMAGIYAQQGQVDQAIALYQQSLEIKERIGDVQGKAATLAMMGVLSANNGDFQTAISYLQESLTILQHLKSPDAATVQSWLEQVQQIQKSPPLQGG
ncbi:MULTISPECIES: tetratricopeptide repeat protein [Pseudanabaena]|uniref:tetratricopeptide repeat protein n=1 Tax=Pseudanabaena TaxID=1152 RepID=UPI00247A7661|nr:MULTISPECIES: tetratricopeptide repeat protein [Pseudanabaena]MEA5489894.1 tetratricopeptide repeat protein [Pseudanabaena sp. CCNP1317]WGS74495.1 tetratricopeptide repeat protein [Pseudanabaena galeata CCNP1313]